MQFEIRSKAHIRFSSSGPGQSRHSETAGRRGRAPVRAGERQLPGTLEVKSRAQGLLRKATRRCR